MGVRFEASGLEPRLLQGVEEMGFDEMFPIQAEAIAPLLEGRDVFGQAHTGAGKTLAYALPMLQKIDRRASGLQGLVVVPTRELALQVATEFERLARHLRVRVAAIYGGQSIRGQIEKVNTSSCKIIVATPGRLIDHLNRRTVSLSNVTFVVLDEADRMLDMGFIEDVAFILQHLPRHHQTALFSATMPEEIVRLGRRYMKDPLRIFVDSDELSVDSVQQRFFRVEENGKFPALRFILDRERVKKGLVFCETKVRAGRLATALQRENYNVLALHGDLSQRQREMAVDSFRTGETNLLVATDVAARGLDIPWVSHVMNYDMPDEPLMYFHRIGRTARAGRGGVAVSLVSPEDEGGFSKVRRMTSATINEVAQPVQFDRGSRFPGMFLPRRPSRGRIGRGGFPGKTSGRYHSRRDGFRRNHRR